MESNPRPGEVPPTQLENILTRVALSNVERVASNLSNSNSSDFSLKISSGISDHVLHYQPTMVGRRPHRARLAGWLTVWLGPWDAVGSIR